MVRFDTGATNVVLDLDMLATAEFRGLDETGRWLARDLAGSVIGEGWLDPAEHPDRAFPIAVDGTVGSIELSATAYGRGEGTDRISNNSDFALDRIHWTPVTTAPPTTAPPTTAPSTTTPSTTAPSTTAPTTTSTPPPERVELTPSDRVGSAWGDQVVITALDAAGSAVELGTNRNAFGPSSGRYHYQLDYDPTTDRSEAVLLDFAIPVSDVVVELRHLETDEWQGMDETGVWTAIAQDGSVIGSGLIDPELATNGPTAGDKRFALDLAGPVSQLRIEATAYDHGLGNGRTSNNSDFALVGLAYTPASTTSVDSSTTQSSTVQPSMPQSSTTEPSTTHPSPTGETGTHETHGDATIAVASGQWSDPATWGGMVPMAGHPVGIPDGVTVVIDRSPDPIGSLVVAGTLELADVDLDIEVDSIAISGQVRAGSEGDRFEHSATITLTGTDEHSAHGSRSVAVMDGGSLELHGASADKRPWTVLDGSIAPGDTALTLADTTDWEVGDRIVIAPTGIEAFEDEVVTIVAIDGTEVRFEPALRFGHHGAIERHAGRDLDMRGEVGLLSHDIVITSPADAESTLVGGHVMVMAGGSARLEGVELRGLGQSGVAGRYPFHWHLAGDVSGQYVRNSSVAGSLQRGIVVHGTSNATVEGVVAHDTLSHAFVWSESGDEWGNQLIGNLAVRVNNLDRSSGLISFPRTGRNGQPSLQISSQAETRSSGFWGRNPENTMIGNHVAGVDHGQGFFFDSRHVGHSMKAFMKTSRAEIVFEDNAAHSIEGIARGFYNYGPAARGHAVFVSTYVHHPVIEVSDFTAYHAVTGAWLEDENTVLVDSVVADSAAGVFVHHARCARR